MIEVLFGSQANPAVVAAAIAALTSVGVSFIAQFFNLFSGVRLERLRSDLLRKIESARAELSDLNSARNARRDYEYDARKRLYAEIEPLLFQLYEAAEQSYYRVRSLARTAKGGDLGPVKRNWLGDNGYYLHSTMYYMILPAVVFRLIRNRMTFVDLDLDVQITTKYYLTKIYAFSLTDDFLLADAGKKLPYKPNDTDWKKHIKTNPAQYARQGLVVGDMDLLLDEMLIEKSGQTKTLTYSEFESRLPDEIISGAMSEFRSLYFKFHPELKPVLARMLLVQACLSNLILESYEIESAAELRSSAERFVNSDEFGRSFAWADEISSDDRALVLDYVIERLSWIPDRSRRQDILT